MDAKKTDLVVKSNVLIEASYRLTLTEQRIILAAIVEARQSQKGLGRGVLTIYAKDFSALFPDVEEGSAYGQLREAAGELFRRQVTIHDIHPESGKPRITEARWISSSSYIPGIGAVQIRIASEIIPYITRLEENLTRYRLERIAKLSSAHAVRLYELLLQYKGIGSREMGLEWLKGTLQIGEAYKSIKDFKKYVIDSSLKQINEHTDLSVTYENVKTGRAVTGLYFHISEKEDKPVLAKKKADKPLLPLRITKAYIDKNNLGRVGESYDEAIQRLTQEALKQREKESK